MQAILSFLLELLKAIKTSSLKHVCLGYRPFFNLKVALLQTVTYSAVALTVTHCTVEGASFECELQNSGKSAS